MQKLRNQEKRILFCECHNHRQYIVCGSAEQINLFCSRLLPIFAQLFEMSMEIIKTEIEGVVIIEPRIFKDARGYFFESFSEREFSEKVADVHFVQDNESRSCYGVIRGLHFQKPPYTQAKLLRVVRGAVLDVAVDLRKGSPTFGKYVAVELTEENHRQLYIPRGFAHGFSVLSEDVVFQYKCDNYYAPQSEGAIAWDDPELGIDWRIPKEKAILSEKDSRHPRLKDADIPFSI